MAAGGPRPIRSATEQRGLPGNSAKEWAQVLIGDRLLRFMIEIIVTLATMGMCGFVEHPQYPIWRVQGDAASIWTMDVIRYLKSLQCFSLF